MQRTLCGIVLSKSPSPTALVSADTVSCVKRVTCPPRVAGRSARHISAPLVTSLCVSERMDALWNSTRTSILIPRCSRFSTFVLHKRGRFLCCIPCSLFQFLEKIYWCVWHWCFWNSLISFKSTVRQIYRLEFLLVLRVLVFRMTPSYI